VEGYFIFLFLTFVVLTLGYITRKRGFYNLTIRRELTNNAVVEGEEIKFTTVVENKKWLPISFLHVQETFPFSLPRVSEDAMYNDNDKSLVYNNKYSVLWFERIKRDYKVKGTKRGAYLVKDISISIGDLFGFSFEEKELEDYKEVVVYPKLIDVSKLSFNTTSIQGDNIVKRWIYKDPLYIKGIREYNVEDRMKDIHWQSSLKMSKLMVKDYDYTSEKEIVFIVNSQCGAPHWATINSDVIDNAIKVAVSLAAKAQSQGFAVGMWTNSQIVSFNGNVRSEVEPSANNLKGILELGARMDYFTKVEFNKYLEDKIKNFNHNATYVVITPFLDSDSESILRRLRRAGTIIKLIDVSKRGDVPSIDGIDKILYKGERT